MDHQHDELPSFWRSPAGIGLAVVILVGGFYLLTEHRAHVFGTLPYLFVLACPLMHVFMHHGHRRGRHPPARHWSNDDEHPGQ